VCSVLYQYLQEIVYTEIVIAWLEDIQRKMPVCHWNVVFIYPQEPNLRTASPLYQNYTNVRFRKHQSPQHQEKQHARTDSARWYGNWTQCGVRINPSMVPYVITVACGLKVIAVTDVCDVVRVLCDGKLEPWDLFGVGIAWVWDVDVRVQVSQCSR